MFDSIIKGIGGFAKDITTGLEATYDATLDAAEYIGDNAVDAYDSTVEAVKSIPDLIEQGYDEGLMTGDSPEDTSKASVEDSKDKTSPFPPPSNA